MMNQLQINNILVYVNDEWQRTTTDDGLQLTKKLTFMPGKQKIRNNVSWAVLTVRLGFEHWILSSDLQKRYFVDSSSLTWSNMCLVLTVWENISEWRFWYNTCLKETVLFIFYIMVVLQKLIVSSFHMARIF